VRGLDDHADHRVLVRDEVASAIVLSRRLPKRRAIASIRRGAITSARHHRPG
jgi:hypothetical protein